MYALRRTIAAALIGGALLFSAVPVTAAPPHVHTLAQVLAAGKDPGTAPGADTILAAGLGSTGTGSRLSIGPANLDPSSRVWGGDAWLAAGHGAFGGSTIVAGGDGGSYTVNGDGGQVALMAGFGFHNGVPVPPVQIILQGGQADGTPSVLYLIVPEGDPHIAGAVYTDNGTVKVSAG